MLSFKNTCLPTGKKGFTLIELLIAIVIVGLLATLVMVNIGGATSRARDTRRASDLKQIATALELYYQDANYYPGGTGGTCYSDTTTGGTCTSWSTLLDVGGVRKYIPLVPKDPKNASYNIYKYCNVDGTKFVVVATFENDIPAAQRLDTNSSCKITIGLNDAPAAKVFWVGN